MTPQTSARLKALVEDIIKEEEHDLDYKLSAEDYDFLFDFQVQHIPRSIKKFVEGGLEHNEDHTNPFVGSVMHLQEVLKELIDAPYYVQAAIQSARNATK